MFVKFIQLVFHWINMARRLLTASYTKAKVDKVDTIADAAAAAAARSKLR